MNSNTLITQLNNLEQWIQGTSKDYHLYPLRMLGYLLLFLVLMISNSLAMIRWPFAALKRSLFHTKSDKNDFSFSKDEIHAVNNDELDRVLSSGEKVLVDFWAEWCGPCIMMNEPLKRLAKSGEVDCIIVKVDTVKHPDIAKRYQVKGLPTLLLFEENEMVKRNAGALSQDELKAFVES